AGKGGPGNSFDPLANLGSLLNGLNGNKSGLPGKPGTPSVPGTNLGGEGEFGGMGDLNSGYLPQSGKDKQLGRIISQGAPGYGTARGEGSYWGGVIGQAVGGVAGYFVGSAIGGSIGVATTAKNAGDKETERATQQNQEADFLKQSTDKKDGSNSPKK